MLPCSGIKQFTHFVFAAWLTFSNSKCFGKGNMLLKFYVRSLSVSVGMSFFGNQSLYLCSGTNCLLLAGSLCPLGNRVGCVCVCVVVCTLDGGVCVYKDTPLWSIEYTWGGKHDPHSFYPICCLRLRENVSLINEHVTLTTSIQTNTN